MFFFNNTNRAKFFKGQVDKYTWVDFGDSYLPSELNAAYLWAQLQKADMINDNRISTWNHYYKELKPLADKGLFDIPYIPSECVHNAHMFYIKCKNFARLVPFSRRISALSLYVASLITIAPPSPIE